MPETEDKQIIDFVRNLSHPEVYERKHAAWMLARLAQKGKSSIIVKAGAIQRLLQCLDDEMIVKYRAVWALGMLARHGQGQAVLDAGAIRPLRELAHDETRVEICQPITGEIIITTLGSLARDALESLQT